MFEKSAIDRNRSIGKHALQALVIHGIKRRTYWNGQSTRPQQASRDIGSYLSSVQLALDTWPTR